MLIDNVPTGIISVLLALKAVEEIIPKVIEISSSPYRPGPFYNYKNT